MNCYCIENKLLTWPKKSLQSEDKITVRIFMSYRYTVRSCDIMRYQLRSVDRCNTSSERADANQSLYCVLSRWKNIKLVPHEYLVCNTFLAMIVPHTAEHTLCFCHFQWAWQCAEEAANQFTAHLYKQAKNCNLPVKDRQMDANCEMPIRGTHFQQDWSLQVCFVKPST